MDNQGPHFLARTLFSLSLPLHALFPSLSLSLFFSLSLSLSLSLFLSLSLCLPLYGGQNFKYSFFLFFLESLKVHPKIEKVVHPKLSSSLTLLPSLRYPISWVISGYPMIRFERQHKIGIHFLYLVSSSPLKRFF